MKVTSKHIEGGFRLYPMSDLHWPIHDQKKLDQWIEAVDSDPSAVVTLGGDLVDFARTTARNHLRSYMGDLNSLGPVEELAAEHCASLARFLMPVRDKVVGAVAGNHHYRFADGRISDQLVLDGIGRPDAWMGAFGLIRFDVAFGPFSIPCKVALHHDAGRKGGTLASDVNAFVHWSHAVDANIYCAGHTHRQWAMPAAACVTVPDQGVAEISDTKRIFVRSGAWMKSYPDGGADNSKPYLPEYAVEKMLPPTILGIVSVGVKVKSNGSLSFDIGHQTL